jgi:hypothetical protein
MGYDPALVRRILRLVNINEFKRHQTAPVLRVSPKAFGVGRTYAYRRKVFELILSVLNKKKNVCSFGRAGRIKTKRKNQLFFNQLKLKNIYYLCHFEFKLPMFS